jgi:alcohol dehydrogenase (cytochrome c)
MKRSFVKRSLLIVSGVLVALLAVFAGTLHALRVQPVTGVFMGIHYVQSLSAPPGTIVTELAPGVSAARPGVSPVSRESAGDWPSYNKTLTSERFSKLDQINSANVGKLKVLCTYDTGEYFVFESGMLMVNGALIATTDKDIFSLDPADCHENWRSRADYPPNVFILPVNRGAAYLDGLLFRGTQDGRVLAYEFKTGRQVWETTLADPKLGENLPSAPIAWNGMVFIGTAGGDFKGNKGRMYALDAKTGKIVWEFYLVPKAAGDVARGPQGATPLDTSTWHNAPATPVSGGATWTSYTLDPETGELYVPVGNPAPDFALGPREGENLFTDSIVVLDAKSGAYRNHFKLVPKDWHDWDASAAPAVIRTRAGKKLLAVAPKDGHLYGFDLADNAMLFRVPATRIENVEASFATDKPVRFCPGAGGGAEWNGPAYDPQTNAIFIGENEWCSTVTVQGEEDIRNVKPGTLWMAMDTRNPLHITGAFDSSWAGWVYAVDADTGKWKWRLKSNYPVLSGVTPTAGGIVFFGDHSGNFYAVDAADGRQLWGQKIGGAIAGGVITYTANGVQMVAVATGFTSVGWRTEIATGKIVILGLDNVAATQ